MIKRKPSPKQMKILLLLIQQSGEMIRPAGHYPDRSMRACMARGWVVRTPAGRQSRYRLTAGGRAEAHRVDPKACEAAERVACGVDRGRVLDVDQAHTEALAEALERGAITRPAAEASSVVAEAPLSDQIVVIAPHPNVGPNRAWQTPYGNFPRGFRA